MAFCNNDECRLKRHDEIFKRRAEEERLAFEEAERKRKAITGAMKFDLGSDYNHASLSKWIAPSFAQEYVLDWFRNEKPFLFIMGSPGVGKTYLSAAVLNYLDERQENIFYTTHRRLIDKIHRSIENGKPQMDPIDRISGYKYLIFDDLGSATCTEWQQEMILELIDRRYSNNLKTLITTNLDEKKIQDKLGHRTASRILDVKNSKLSFWTEDNRLNRDFYEQHRK